MGFFSNWSDKIFVNLGTSQPPTSSYSLGKPYKPAEHAMSKRSVDELDEVVSRPKLEDT